MLPARTHANHGNPVVNPVMEPLPRGGQDLGVQVDALLDALQATGESRSHALAHAAQVFSPDIVWPHVLKETRGWGGERWLALLDEAADVDPGSAQAWLGMALVEGRMGPWKDHAGTDGHHFKGCAWIETFPDNLHFQGALTLESCGALRALPEGLRVSGYLNAAYCSKLRHIPGDLWVHGNLRLSGCGDLEGLPQGLFPLGDLALHDCRSLRTLPEGLAVAGALVLNGCASLTALPRELKVGRYLDLRRCLAWDGIIPLDVRVADKVYLDGHSQGVALPEARRLQTSKEHQP